MAVTGGRFYREETRAGCSLLERRNKGAGPHRAATREAGLRGRENAGGEDRWRVRWRVIAGLEWGGWKERQ